MWDPRWGMGDLLPWPGMEPGLPAGRGAGISASRPPGKSQKWFGFVFLVCFLKKICCCLLNRKTNGKRGKEELEKKGDKRDGRWWQRRWWENQGHEDIGNQDILFLVPLLQLTGGVTLTNYRLFEIHFPYC